LVFGYLPLKLLLTPHFFTKITYHSRNFWEGGRIVGNEGTRAVVFRAEVPGVKVRVRY